MRKVMKRFLSLAMIWSSVFASAEVITMDLSTATDMALNPVTYSATYGNGYYDCTDVWDSTYNDSGMCQYIYTNDARFMLSHMPSQNAYGGMSWEGFTLSQVSQDTANVFGCVANGGVGEVGTPYVIGYYSEWVTESLGYSSNTILFDQAYYPEYVYVCQNSNTMEAIAHGGVFNSRVFTEKDTLALIVNALDSTLQPISTMTYYLAVDGKKNAGWEKVPLTALGKAVGLSFSMTTTDIGQFGANTPLYFALDALTVNTEPLTALHTPTSPMSDTRLIMRNANLYILHNGKTYTIEGKQIAY
jgi:hypothetical protein